VEQSAPTVTAPSAGLAAEPAAKRRRAPRPGARHPAPTREPALAPARPAARQRTTRRPARLPAAPTAIQPTLLDSPAQSLPTRGRTRRAS
jgi:hypothetical protein